MCCTIVLAAPDFVIACVDTRWTWDSADGLDTESWHEDLGQKLRRSRDGWVVATGEARLAALALREAEARGVSGIGEAFEDALDETRAYNGRDPRLSHILAAGDDGSITVASTETGVEHVPHGPKIQSQISWPANISDATEMLLHDALAGRIGAQHDMVGVIHCVILAFREAHGLDPVSMSDTIEIGLSTLPGYYGQPNGYQGYLRAKPADIVPGSNLRFIRPPEPEPFPNAAEARLFGIAASKGGLS